jgi:hypothetical protein
MVAVGTVLMLTACPMAGTACDLRIIDVTSAQWSGNHGRGYEVYDPQRGALVITFRVQTQTGNCPFFVTVSPSSSAPGGGSGALHGPGAALRYDLFKDASASQLLKPVNVASTNDVFVGSAPSGSSQTTLQFADIVWAGQVVPPGLYADDIAITAYEGVLGSGILRDQRHVPSSAVVPAVAEISFAEGASFDPNVNTYTVNFNTMHGGDLRTARLKARSNGGYRIILSSLNGGVMRHVDPRDDSTVPYYLMVDGAQVALPKGASPQAIINVNMTPVTGDLHSLEFHIVTTEGASAGDYRDVINISVFSLR